MMIHLFKKSMSDQKKGLFITFEGGEGTGKSTQIQEIASLLEKKGILLETTREPGGSNLAESIRSLFLQDNLHPTEEMLLILAGRHHHIRTRIQPALDKGRWVLCDRFIDSSLVYQGLTLGHDSVVQWHQMAHINFRPDITFLLQDPSHIMLKNRTHQSSNRFDQKDCVFHDRIHHAYMDIAQKNPDRYIIVPPEKNIKETSNFILLHIEKKWKYSP